MGEYIKKGLFRFQEELRDNLMFHLEEEIEEFENAISLLEDLVYIRMEENSFDISFGEYLNSVGADDWDMKKGFRLPEFFEKLAKLKDDVSFTVNALEQIVQGEDVSSTKREYYKIAWEYTNTFEKNSLLEEYSPDEIHKSVFYVYMDQCLMNQSAIENGFNEHALAMELDFVGFAKGIEGAEAEDKEFYENKFVDLKWLNVKQPVELTYEESVKFIGEPGVGKTTKMRKLFWEEVAAVKNGARKALPVWVELKELNEVNDLSLDKAIKEKLLQEHCENFEILLENGWLSLYLDGYNEVIVSEEREETFKTNLSRYIDKLHEEYKKVRICITDRMEKSVPACMEQDVTVLRFEGMSIADMKDYAVKMQTEEDAKKILQFLDSEDSIWMNSDRLIMIPEKMNMLMELVLSPEENPRSLEDFYGKYLESIIERERTKKETRLSTLESMLEIFATELGDAGEEMKVSRVKDMWNERIGDYKKTEKLLELAMDMHILEPGKKNRTCKFKYEQYFDFYR